MDKGVGFDTASPWHLSKA